MAPLLNVDDYEHATRDLLEASIYDYIAGGARDEITLTENRTAYDRWRLRPRNMVNVEQARPYCEYIGRYIDPSNRNCTKCLS